MAPIIDTPVLFFQVLLMLSPVWQPQLWQYALRAKAPRFSRCRSVSCSQAVEAA